MKKYTFISLLLFWSINLFSQVPQMINYQSVPRDPNGIPLTNINISFQMNILEGGPTGSVVYSERHFINTGELGLVNIPIGGGQPVTGIFNDINWSAGKKWLKIEVDITGGTNFTPLSSQEFLSTPYSLFSAKAGTFTNASISDLNDVNTVGASSGQVLKWSGSSWIPSEDNWGSQFVQTDASLSGNGKLATPLKLAQQGASSNQVLKWTGTSWEPSEDNWGSQFVQTDVSLSGNGKFSTPLKLAQQGATLNQVLKWSGTNWLPAEDNWGSQAVQTNSTLTGNGTISNSLKLAQQAATNGQVLKWNGTTWMPASDNGQTYYPGKGISFSNDTINTAWTSLGSRMYNNNSGVVSIGSTTLNEGKFNVSQNLRINNNPKIGIFCEFIGEDPSCREPAVGIKSLINSDCGYAGFFESTSYSSLLPSLSVTSNSRSALQAILRDTNLTHNNTKAISGSNFHLSQNAIGVYGYQSNNGIGVYGSINGIASTSVGAAEVAGVVGEVTNVNAGSGSCGVKGLNRGTGLNGVGVQGAQFGNGWGVWGYVTGTNASGRAIYGQSSGELGYGGYFKGRVKIEKHPITVSPYLEIPGSNWDLQNSDGDLKIGDASYALKIGVAIGGVGAGDCYLLAKGGKNRMTFGQGNNTRVMTINNGNVIIGNSEATHNNLLQVNHTGYAYGLGIINGAHNWDINLVGASGSLKLNKGGFYKGTFDAITGEYSYVSDVRLKTNIQSLGSILPLILKLKPQSYKWKNDSTGRKSIGFIAQDLQKIFPEMVHQNDGKDELLTINYSGLGVIAIKAIQEQQIIINQLEVMISSQKNEIDLLKNQNQVINNRMYILEDKLSRIVANK